MYRRLVGAFIACICVFGWTATGYSYDWGPFSLRLRQGMTEQEAINAIGYLPNKVEQKTCGSNSSGGAWSCRILAYSDFRGSLRVYEQHNGDLWVVNGWDVYP
jgi:hypothetical protein